MDSGVVAKSFALYACVPQAVIGTLTSNWFYSQSCYSFIVVIECKHCSNEAFYIREGSQVSLSRASCSFFQTACWQSSLPAIGLYGVFDLCNPLVLMVYLLLSPTCLMDACHFGILGQAIFEIKSILFQIAKHLHLRRI